MAALLLASASPRRRELLSSAGIDCDVLVSDIDESAIRGASPLETATLLARAKTEAVLNNPASAAWQWVLGADTLIDLDGRSIEKALNRNDASSILQSLSGRAHRVISAVCLYCREENLFMEDNSVSTVVFKQLDSDELNWYLDSGEWRGAAGAYMVQGRAACFVEDLRGPHSGVVGLPLPLIYGMLRESGYRFGQSA